MPNQSHMSFLRELAKHDAVMAQRFAEIVTRITSQAQLAALDAAIDDGDFARVFAVLGLDNSFWAPLDAQITDAYRAGALWQLSQLPKKAGPAGLDLRIGFDHRNPLSERWMRDAGARLITEIVEDQRSGVRREIEEGIAQGESARAVRQRLIGKLDGNQRTGGIVGLHSRDMRAVARAREELSDPATLAEYMRRAPGLGRKLPPNGRTIRSAIKQGRALTAAEIDKTIRMYSDKLLRDRGSRIARTEMHSAFSEGRRDAMRQLVERFNAPLDAITRTWQATVGSARTRDSHREMHDQQKKGIEPFVSPVTGALMMGPGDNSLGAPAEEIIHCRCSERIDIDYTKLAI